ncbi:MAG: hypothetical protein NZ805_04680 [Armatimonadetes bacterium]|nr:hypothetical protein [Armatimonadota bacterium]MDW8027235.1 hypothetical protein [Armatimonadota bacterium]
MIAEQLAHKFWLALDKARGKEICASVESATLKAKVRNHDAFSCLLESLSLQWETEDEWEKLLEVCERGLKTLHKDFAIIERDDLNQMALFRSPLTRNFYWEAQLKREDFAILSINRYQVKVEGKRNLEPFVLTEEQLAEFIAGIMAG